MLSFWEKESFVNYDFAIVGGGIVGLSTAIELKASRPEATVVVLERGVFPSGASTKNAGFACFGSLTEVLSDLENMPEEEVLALVKKRWDGLQILRNRLGDSSIDFQNNGGYELLRSDREIEALEHKERVNDLLRPLFESDVYQEPPKSALDMGFDANSVKYLVFNPFEGQIHTGKMMKALQKLAVESGIDLLTGAVVDEISEEHARVNVLLKNGIRINARQLAVCTNAFTSALVNLADLSPGRGVVVVTKPIPGLKFRGTFHYDEGFYYFRNFENRVIFGGARNLDVEGETTTDFGQPELILNKLKKDLRELILPGMDFEIAHGWSGIMAFGATKQPVLRQQSDRIFVGVRLGGMGVAIGSILGKDLAHLMTKSGNN